MAKYVISEERLSTIIKESIEEALEEGERFNNFMNKAGMVVGNINTLFFQKLQ
jgi:hypothetical protein